MPRCTGAARLFAEDAGGHDTRPVSHMTADRLTDMLVMSSSSDDLVYSVFHCSKSILEEYCEISSLLTEEIVKVHQEISAAVEQIDPLAEYQQFIDAYRSGNKTLSRHRYHRRSIHIHRVSSANSMSVCCNRSPETPEASVDFDTSLLEETDNLPANEILWNTLTADSLQAM